MNFDRSQAVKHARDKSARADMMQHAKKLIQGFEKLDDSHARRAIWELVQNACDLSGNCDITIDFRSKGFSFSHNGKPFSSETLLSLIKQVSSKSSNSKEEVGQFGTGFITTHSFGKKFTINSYLEEGGIFIKIDDFLIDRQAKNEDQLLDKLAEQEQEVYKLINEGSVVTAPEVLTVFNYLPETEPAKQNIAQAANNLHHYIPLVLAINASLQKVTVIDSTEEEVVYEKGEEVLVDAVINTLILRNGKPINTYSLKSGDGYIQVVLPITDLNSSIKISDSIAKLFLYFPLIGTEKWGCNFIIHSKLFAPTEPRDGVHLKSKNEQIQEKEEANRQIIATASEMIFAFIEQYAALISDPINLAYVAFDTKSNAELLNGYYKELKQSWVGRLKAVKLVETESGRRSPEETVFISSEFLRIDRYYDAIYALLTLFWKDQLPKKSIAKEWTNIVTDWEDNSVEFVSIEMLVRKIEEQHSVTAFDENILLNFYQYLIEVGKGDLFNHYKLLPNIKEQFVTKETIAKPIHIDQIFISIADVITPDVPIRFIKNNYELGLEYSDYGRENLSKEFNSQIIAHHKNLTPQDLLPEPFRNALISLCSIYPADNTTSVRRRIMPHICLYYRLDYKEVIIPNIDEDKIDYDYTPFRGLIKNFFLDIIQRSSEDSKWLTTNIEFLKECLTIVAKHYELKEIVETTPIFPNQNFELRLQSDLAKETQFPSDESDAELLKDFYAEVIEDVKADLILNDFADLITNSNVKTGAWLAGQLEDQFKAWRIEPINEHPYKKIIFQIIQKTTESPQWERLFSYINSNKALIMMSKISDEDVKNDLFSIIGLDDKDKIAALGELSKNPDLEKIIELGKKAVEDNHRENADFTFKKQIGVHIEDLVRKKIGSEVERFEIKVIEQQGGQDIIAFLNDKPVYYIEVKSRWDVNSSLLMSNSQIKNAAKNKKCYALCSVDMTDYYPAEGNRYRAEDISEIVSRIGFLTDIGHRLEPLIMNAILVENNDDNIRLTDDYKAIVPQVIIKKGISLSEFIDYLIENFAFANVKKASENKVTEIENG